MTTEIENVIKKYAWAMDELDKETWLSIFNEDLKSYNAYMFGDPVPVAQIPVDKEDPLYDEIGDLSPKKQLEYKCDGMIFKRMKVAQSTVSNVMINLTSDNTATGKDYFRHWEIVDPNHPASTARNLDDKHWYFQEGKHEWEFQKENGIWKVINFKCVIYRTEARNRQVLE